MEPPLIDLKLSTKTRLRMMKVGLGLCIFIFALSLFQVYVQLQIIQDSTSYMQTEVGSLSQADFERIQQREANNYFAIRLQLVIMACLFVMIGGMAYSLGKYSKPTEAPKAGA
jgi:Na+/H+ antiporter NhaC